LAQACELCIVSQGERNGRALKMSRGDAIFNSFSFNVPGLEMFGEGDLFEYKLPYTVAEVPCCARINGCLLCCDYLCCTACCSKNGQLGFMDMVNQQDGHQIRFRVKKKCCYVPKVLAFYDGQYIGHASRTMRCLNRCLTCMDDLKKNPVLQVGLHDENDQQLAKIERNGKGCCCQCFPTFPCKCNGCMFTCMASTCLCAPSYNLSKLDLVSLFLTEGMCAGCQNCDPVCMPGCVRGDKTLCSLKEVPILYFGCCCAPVCCCPCPGTEKRLYPVANTCMFEDFPVMSSSGDKQVGALQFQYRGNYPSAYTHDQMKPLKINAAAESVKLGQLMAALSAGRVYEMGEAQPVFESVKALPTDTSPNFTGTVFAKQASQVRSLVDAINPNTMVVMQDAMLGDHLTGTQVKGWKLTYAGYKREKGICCCIEIGVGGLKPRYIATLEELRTLVTGALEGQAGSFGTTFELLFQLPDQEQQIVKKGDNTFGMVSDMSGSFNPGGGGFAEQMEEVRLACTCIQCWRFPCNFNQKKTYCCSMPCYAQKVNNTEVQPFSYGKGAPGADSPPQVIMHPGTKIEQIIGARKDAWAAPAKSQ